MQIRAADAPDVASIEALFEELDALHCQRLPYRFRASVGPVRSPEYLIQLVRGPDTAILLAEDAGNMLGFIHLALRTTPELPLFVPRRFALVENLIVAERARRRGVGRALMAEAEAWAHGRGVDSVELTVYEINDEAVAFYRALGYCVLSRRLFKH